MSDTMRSIGESDIEARLRRIGERLSDEPETFRCHHCRDIGRIMRTDEAGNMYGRACGHCEIGRRAKRVDEVQAARDLVERNRGDAKKHAEDEAYLREAETIRQGKRDADRWAAQSEPGETESDEELPF